MTTRTTAFGSRRVASLVRPKHFPPFCVQTWQEAVRSKRKTVVSYSKRLLQAALVQSTGVSSEVGRIGCTVPLACMRSSASWCSQDGELCFEEFACAIHLASLRRQARGAVFFFPGLGAPLQSSVLFNCMRTMLHWLYRACSSYCVSAVSLGREETEGRKREEGNGRKETEGRNRKERSGRKEAEGRKRKEGSGRMEAEGRERNEGRQEGTP